MQRDEDEDAWRAIVDNYGDRAEIEDDAPPPAPAPQRWVMPEPAPSLPVEEPAEDPDDPDAFVPPDPDLPPIPTRDRQFAWAGLIGAPILLMVLLVASIRIPSLLAYALIGAFVGGFLYLTFHLPRSNDDPFDDGARL